MRAAWQEGSGQDWTSFPIARLRYVKATQAWTLYWRDGNLRRLVYERLQPSSHVADLLTEIDRVPTSNLPGLTEPAPLASWAVRATSPDASDFARQLCNRLLYKLGQAVASGLALLARKERVLRRVAILR